TGPPRGLLPPEYASFVAFGLPVRERLRFAVVSPHLDDAILSLGAGIMGAGRAADEVSVVTVFAGDPESRAPAARWDARAGAAAAPSCGRGSAASASPGRKAAHEARSVTARERREASARRTALPGRGDRERRRPNVRSPRDRHGRRRFDRRVLGEARAPAD